MTTTNLILGLLILLIFISFFVFLGKTQTERLINTLLSAFSKDKQTVLTKTDDVSKELSILNTKVDLLLSKNADVIIKQENAINNYDLILKCILITGAVMGAAIIVYLGYQMVKSNSDSEKICELIKKSTDTQEGALEVQKDSNQIIEKLKISSEELTKNHKESLTELKSLASTTEKSNTKIEECFRIFKTSENQRIESGENILSSLEKLPEVVANAHNITNTNTSNQLNILMKKLDMLPIEVVKNFFANHDNYLRLTKVVAAVASNDNSDTETLSSAAELLDSAATPTTNNTDLTKEEADNFLADIKNKFKQKK